MLDSKQKHPESFICSNCGADITECSLHLEPGDIKINKAKIVIRNSQQRFQLPEEDYNLLLNGFRNSHLTERIIRVSCFSCGQLFCELSQDSHFWIKGILETNGVKFCRK